MSETVASKPFPEVLAAFRENPSSLLWQTPGVWLLDKPGGPSSNLMVVRARKALGVKRVGHAGTLDPLASGLLVLLSGNATRLFDSFQTMGKTYEAWFRLGERRDTQDITGEILPDYVPERNPPLSRDEVEAALTCFHGDILQTPPMYSALKKDGEALYKKARRGEVVERAARNVHVYSLALHDFDGAAGRLVMTVSKGFYVRTLIDDLGLTLGCGSVMTALRRTAVGDFTLDNARTIEELA